MSVPDADVTAIEITYPDKRSAALGASQRRRPKAAVACTLSTGRVITYDVPVKVARLVAKNQPDLPAPFERVRSVVLDLEERTCFNVLIEMLSRRDYACEEARGKLAHYGYFPSSIDKALERAASYSFINDEQFMVRFVESRKARGWGRRKIERELALHGVDVDAIPGYPDRFFSVEDETDRARAVVAKRPVPAARAFEKLVKYLMGKGFSYAAASEAVRERLAMEDESRL